MIHKVQGRHLSHTVSENCLRSHKRRRPEMLTIHRHRLRSARDVRFVQSLSERARSFAGHDSSAKSFYSRKNRWRWWWRQRLWRWWRRRWATNELWEHGGQWNGGHIPAAAKDRSVVCCVARDRVCVSVRCACVQVSMRLYMLSRRARVIDPHCGMRLQRYVAFLRNTTLDLYV